MQTLHTQIPLESPALGHAEAVFTQLDRMTMGTLPVLRVAPVVYSCRHLSLLNSLLILSMLHPERQNVKWLELIFYGGSDRDALFCSQAPAGGRSAPTP